MVNTNCCNNESCICGFTQDHPTISPYGGEKTRIISVPVAPGIACTYLPGWGKMACVLEFFRTRDQNGKNNLDGLIVYNFIKDFYSPIYKV
jgi:hypothetical protein